MRDIDEFKERILNDSEFAKKLRNVKSRKDIIKLARENNYNFTDEELKRKDIGEDVLDAVAGGTEKGSTEYNQTNIYGSNSYGFTGTKKEGEILANLIRTDTAKGEGAKP